MKLNLLVVRAGSPEVTKQFYEHLGLSFAYHRHGNGPFHYSANMKGTTFEIYPLLKSQAVADRSLRLGFEVKALAPLLTRMEKAGTRVLQPGRVSEWGYQAIILDPDGRKIELTEAKGR